MTQQVARWIPNPVNPCSKPLGGSKVKSAFHPSKVDLTSTILILEIEGSVRQRQKRALFSYKKPEKGTSNLNDPYVHSTFTMLLIKQIFEKYKSLVAASENRTQFWPKITPGVPETLGDLVVKSKLTPRSGCIGLRQPVFTDKNSLQ